MTAQVWIIGSLPECDIRVESPTVSGKHCRLTQRGECYLLEDLQSTNGTFVDGEPIDGRRIVRQGDRISLGKDIPLPWPTMPVAITVGRASDNDLVIPYDAVSGHHARLERESGQAYLIDLGSTNGTAINDPLKKITRAPLAPTDFVFLGTHRIAAVDLLVALPPERPKAKTQLEQNRENETALKHSTDEATSQPESNERAPAWAASIRSPHSWVIGIAASIVVAALILGGARLRRPSDREPDTQPVSDNVGTTFAAPSASTGAAPSHDAGSTSDTPEQRDQAHVEADSSPPATLATAPEADNSTAKPSTPGKPAIAATSGDPSAADSRPVDPEKAARGDAEQTPAIESNKPSSPIEPKTSSRKLAETIQSKPIEIAQVPVSAAPPTNFDIGKEVDLLPLVDPDRHSVRGNWKRDGNELLSPNDRDVLVQVPVTPPPAYRLTIVGQRDEGNDLFIGLATGGKQVVAVMDGWWKGVSGLSLIGGQFADRNSTRREFSNLLGDKRPYTIVCTVHPRSVLVTVNETPVVEWIGDSKDFSLPDQWSQVAREQLFLGANNAVHRIRKLTLEALPEDDDINAMLRIEGIVKLVYQQPRGKPSVGSDQFRVNWIFPDDWPLAVTNRTGECQEFLYAHAPSKLKYELPKANSKVPRRFTAVGHTMIGKARYRIFASDSPDFTNVRPVFESDPSRIVNIDQPLEAKDRYLLLQIEGPEVPAFWLRPTVHQAKKSLPLADLRWPPFSVEIENNEKNDRGDINRVPKWTHRPLDVDHEPPCDEFLFAHAPSEVDYEIPPSAVSFSAIGYCLRPGNVEFQVRVDNRPDPIYSSKAPIAPIHENIPPDAKVLRLKVGDLGHNANDFSFWLYPRFHLATKNTPAKKPAARLKTAR